MNTIIKYSIIGLALIILICIPEGLMFNENVHICIFKNLTGIECPLCGMLRAGYLLIRFKMQYAITYNPLVIILPLWVLLEIFIDLFHSLWLRKVRMIFYYVFIAGLIVLFMFRVYEKF